MDIKIVFVYCGHNRLYYYSLLIAASSIRITNPRLQIVLVTDENSLCFDSVNSKLNLFDKILFQKSSYDDALLNSRNLKTSLGGIIDGSFIFFDNDVLVRRELSWPPKFPNGDLGFVRNLNRSVLSDQINSNDLQIVEKLNVGLTKIPYFNSGMIYSSGSQSSKLFFERWNAEWIRSLSLTGCHVDQPSLYSVLSRSEFKFSEFDDRYNCQLKSRFWFDFFPKYREEVELDSFVWHYFLSLDENEKYTEYEHLCYKFYLNELFSFQEVVQLLKRRSPWRRVFFFDFFVQRLVMKSPQISKELKFLLNGNYFKWIKSFFLANYR